jgi:PAS domain S-box-containing protein
MSRRLRVLILEDSEEDALLVVRELRTRWPELVYDVVASPDALETLLDRPWDLAIADYQFPDATAIDFLHILRERGLDMPFLVVSGTLDDETAARVMRAGADDFLRKESLFRLVPAVERELREAANRREHRTVLEALRQSEQLFRRMVETSHEGIWLLDADDRTIYLNRRMAGMLGLEPQAAVNTSIFDFVNGESGAAIEAYLRRRRGRTELQEVRLTRADGSELWVLIAASPMSEDDGTYTGHVAFVTDVTEQRKIQQQLMVSDRMASVGILAAGVAHEINSPLAAVIANLDLIRERLASAGEAAIPASELAPGLENAREAADQVRQIARDLKLLSRSEDGDREAVDVREVLESALRIAWNQIRHRARLRRELRPVPPVAANASRLGQVFLNLLVNAAQAIPGGRADDHEIRVATGSAPDGRVEVRITDTGGGIPADVRERVFEPFFTTKAVGSGTGLGLAICHRIVTGLGGEIDFESAAGRTEFRVRLPAAPEGAVAAGPARPPPPRPAEPVPRGRLLVVDDDPMIGDVLARLLEADHDVTVLRSARAASARIAAGERFDVILCDLMMPDRTGMDLHEELARAAPDQAERIVFLTGGAFTPRAQAFLEAVPNSRIDKPFDVREVRELVRRFVVR